MNINSISDFRRAVSLYAGGYAWPGGYPLYWLMSDSEACAFDVAKSERRAMLEALRDNDRSGWRPVALEINWQDSELYCAHTGRKIESAYSD